MFPRGRKLLLGVSAGISAYKSCELLRRLQDEGFIVDVVPTSASLNFVGKATWEALSGRKVITEFWTEVETVPHISMAKENDLVVIAPATADIIAKISAGMADDLLTNIVLASNGIKFLVPAMHPEMWSNPATVENIEVLKRRGFIVIEPDEGRMTGADFGIGRYSRWYSRAN
jgi:phosphopantothenoylcysteine decarboxylase/phosphopantothenate--cysteine ligase